MRLNGFSTITVTQLDERLQIPAKTVLLTFDDGDISNYDTAFPILIKNGMKAVFFITTSFIGKLGHVTWEHLKQMHKAGMEIGSHTVSHSIPTELSDESLTNELRESKRILEDGLGASVTSFSSPTGYHNLKTGVLAREAGYRLVFVSKPGYLDTRLFDPLCIKRIAVKRGTRFEEFRDYACCKRTILYRGKALQIIKRVAQGSLGIRSYEKLRESILERMVR